MQFFFFRNLQLLYNTKQQNHKTSQNKKKIPFFNIVYISLCINFITTNFLYTLETTGLNTFQQLYSTVIFIMSQPNKSDKQSPAPSSSATSAPAPTETTSETVNYVSEDRFQAFEQRMLEAFKQFTTRFEQQTAMGINQTREQEARDFQKFNSAGMKLESQVHEVEQETSKLEHEVDAFEDEYKRRVRFEDERFEHASDVMAQAQNKELDLQQQISALREQMETFSTTQLATAPNGSKSNFVTPENIATQIKRIFPQADLSPNDWDQTTNKFPPFMEVYVIDSSEDDAMVNKIQQLQNHFYGNKLIKSSWPYAAQPYLRGDLADGYRYAQLNPINGTLQWIDILNLLRESRNWDIYNIQRTVKYQLYQPEINQSVTEYIRMFRGYANETIGYKNHFQNVKLTLLGHLSKFFPSEIIRHDLVNINSAPNFFNTLNLIFIGVVFPPTSSTTSVAQIETPTEERMDVNYLNQYSKPKVNFNYKKNSKFLGKSNYHGPSKSYGSNSSYNKYDNTNKNYQTKQLYSGRRFRKIYEVDLPESESDENDTDASNDDKSTSSAEITDVKAVQDLALDDFHFNARHR